MHNLADILSSPIPIRAATILTNAYVAGTVIGNANKCYNANQLILLGVFTIGSLTSVSIKVEFSNDNVNFYQETFSAISAGVDTLTAGVHTLSSTANFRLPIKIRDCYIRISALGTGTVTSSSLQLDAVVGWA